MGYLKGRLYSQKSIKAVELRLEHSDWSLQRIGDEVGISREAVRQALERGSVPTAGIHKSKYEHNCPVCGILTSKRSGRKKEAQAYCSKACFSKDHRVTVTCAQCSTQFSMVKGQARRYKLHFCNSECKGRYIGIHYGFVQTRDRIVIHYKYKYNYKQIAELINKGMCYRKVNYVISIPKSTFYDIRRALKLSKPI